MEYKNVLQLYKNQCEKLKKLLIDTSLIGIEEWSILLEEFFELEELLSDPIISEPLDNVKLEVKSPVDKYGVGSYVLALYEDGVSVDNITKQLELQNIYIDTIDLTNWIIEINKQSIIDRTTNRYGSVFDTTSQLQNTLNRLEELAIKVENENNLSNFKKTSKYEVLLSVISEIRKTIKDGHEFTKTIQALQKIDKFQQYVIEEIKQESPECAQRIFRRLSNLATVFSSMDLKGF